MQIVIDIPKEKYEELKSAYRRGYSGAMIDLDIILYGTILPEGHGRLKDIDKIINDGISKGFCDWYDEMKYADTIIEADKENANE